MYRSKCRPKEEEVKGALQKGQVLSLGAPGLFKSVVDPGVATVVSAICSTMLCRYHEESQKLY